MTWSSWSLVRFWARAGANDVEAARRMLPAARRESNSMRIGYWCVGEVLYAYQSSRSEVFAGWLSKQRRSRFLTEEYTAVVCWGQEEEEVVRLAMSNPPRYFWEEYLPCGLVPLEAGL